MSIVLIRHGETPLNAARVIQPPDTALSARGLLQARAVADRLAAEGIASILSSDLPRALLTAQAIAAATGRPVETTPLLQERNFGDLRGQPYDALGYDPIASDDAPPGGESMADFVRRVREAFALVLAAQARADGPLAVVTHGLVIKAILRELARLPSGAGVPDHLPNTSVTVVDATAPHGVTLLNCSRHLEGHASDDGRGVTGV